MNGLSKTTPDSRTYFQESTLSRSLQLHNQPKISCLLILNSRHQLTLEKKLLDTIPIRIRRWFQVYQSNLPKSTSRSPAFWRQNVMDPKFGNLYWLIQFRLFIYGYFKLTIMDKELTPHFKYGESIYFKSTAEMIRRDTVSTRKALLPLHSFRTFRLREKYSKSLGIPISTY